MKIDIQNFSGEIPVLNPRSLPEAAAQTALNCTTRSGKVKLRSDCPPWSDPADNPVESEVDGRKYLIENGVLTEDNIPLAQGKPAIAKVEVVPFWDLETGYRDSKNSPKFQLRHNWGIAGGTSRLDVDKITFDDDKQQCRIHFRYPGLVLDESPGMMIVNGVSEDTCELLYDGDEVSVKYGGQITITDKDHGVYASLVINGIEINKFSPGSGAWTLSGADVVIKCSVVKNVQRRNYVVTYWDGRHESPPSDVSDEVQVTAGDIVRIHLPAYSGGHGDHAAEHEELAPGYYIYRTGGSVTSAGYFFVDRFPGEGVYEDSKEDYLLQEQLSIVENPPDGMKFLHEINGSLVAAIGNTVRFSEPNIENNWPSKYEYRFGRTVTALSVVGNSVIVFSENGSPSILRGSHPSSMSQTKIADGLKCMSSDSVCSSGEDSFYVSEEGLVKISASGQYSVISRNFFSREQWMKMNPESMKCSADNFSIRLYLDSGIIYIFDILPQGLSLTQYNGGSQFTWRSAVFVFPKPVCFRLVRATTESGGGSFSVFAGGLQVNCPCSWINGRPVRIQNIFAREWCFEVSADSDLLEIEAAQSATEMN